MARASAFGAGEVFRGSKSKAPPSSPAGALLPPILRFVIQRQRFVHGSHGVNFPCRRYVFSERTYEPRLCFAPRLGLGSFTFLIARSLFGRWLTDGLRDSSAGISRSRGRLAHGKDQGVARVRHWWRHSSLPSTSSDAAIRTS